jgi:hypothetical protein
MEPCTKLILALNLHFLQVQFCCYRDQHAAPNTAHYSTKRCKKQNNISLNLFNIHLNEHFSLQKETNPTFHCNVQVFDNEYE